MVQVHSYFCSRRASGWDLGANPRPSRLLLECDKVSNVNVWHADHVDTSDQGSAMTVRFLS